MYRFRSYCQFFNLQKKKKKNNPVKQTTPKTGILHEPTSQGRRSQRRNKKKKKRVARESFPRSANDISHLRSHGPVPLELQIYLVPRSFLFLHVAPPSPNKRTSRGLARLQESVAQNRLVFRKENERIRRMDGAWESSGRHVPLAFDNWWRAAISAPRGNGSPPREAERIRRGLAAGVGPRVVFHLYILVLV